MNLSAKPGLKIIRQKGNIFEIEHDRSVDDNDQMRLFMPLAGQVRTMRTSKIGGDYCSADAFFDISGIKVTPDEKSLRNFAIGNILEPLVVDEMRRQGWKVDHNHRDARGIIVALKGGLLTGHEDMKCVAPGSSDIILGDVKTMAEKYFTPWKKNGTKAKFRDYYDQVQTYVHAYSLNQGGIFAFPKRRLFREYTGNPSVLDEPTREEYEELNEIIALEKVNLSEAIGRMENFLARHGALEFERDTFPYDSAGAKAILRRAEKLLLKNEFKIPSKMSGKAYAWKCRFCDKADICKSSESSRKRDIRVANPVKAMRNPEDARDLLAHFFTLHDENDRIVDPVKPLSEILVSTQELDVELGLADGRQVKYPVKRGEDIFLSVSPEKFPQYGKTGTKEPEKKESEKKEPAVQKDPSQGEQMRLPEIPDLPAGETEHGDLRSVSFPDHLLDDVSGDFETEEDVFRDIRML